MKLNELKDRPGAREARKRVGRGLGSGLGKTAGRGGKGQTARSGGAKPGFEGGQMPIYRRLPKRGFNKPFRARFNEVNLGRIQIAVDAKRLDPDQPVTPEALLAAGVITKPFDGVRLLGKGELTAKLSFVVHHASASAVAAVEKLGGTVTLAEARTKPGAEEPPAQDSGAQEPAAEGQ
jgi:large subunit ribosomal protein L15